MFATSTDLIFASAAIAALGVAILIWGQRRSRQHSLESERERQCAQAWTQLQQRCLALVEQDERGGANPEELHRAVAHYRVVFGDPIDVLQDERQSIGTKQVPLLF
jgi:hypothetical protein